MRIVGAFTSLITALALTAPAALAAQAAGGRPFAVGERAEYDVKFGIVHAGTAAAEVVTIDTVRGHSAFGFRLTMTAGVNLLLYKYSVRDTMWSWVDTTTFASLRFNQDQVDGGRPRRKRYEIFPERRAFQDGSHPEQASVDQPLDDLAFLYFVRSQALDVGSSKTWERYFKPDKNPVSLEVLRKDTIEAAGRRWPTIVVRPTIKSSSLIVGEGAKAQVWVSDDSAHVIVQINSKFSFGSITMKLKSYQPPGAAAQAVGHEATTSAPAPPPKVPR